mmetsp:Transcript_39576/g.60506  ORF Transcript_39576/g.60506 Transcript_39576/m.60506 type:complete len:129 (+) Transcript_39576:6232-6618(+)
MSNESQRLEKKQQMCFLQRLGPKRKKSSVQGDINKYIKYQVLEKDMDFAYAVSLNRRIENTKMFLKFAQFDKRYLTLLSEISICISNPTLIPRLPRLRMPKSYTHLELSRKLIEVYHLNMKFILETNL